MAIRNGDGKRVGYIRVSSLSQNTERQLDGIQLDITFTDKASGKDLNRPQLQQALSFLRSGDVLICHSLDRLGRGLDDLRKVVLELTARGVIVEFFKEHLVFTGDDSPMSNLMLSIMGAFAELERSLIRERQLEGIALAKKRGVYRGRKPSLAEPQIADLVRRAKAGEMKAALAREFSISRETVYQYLKSADAGPTAQPAR